MPEYSPDVLPLPNPGKSFECRMKVQAWPRNAPVQETLLPSLQSTLFHGGHRPCNAPVRGTWLPAD